MTDLPVVLDRESAAPIHRQLYDDLRDAILARRLKPGTRLPSSRALAVQLGIGRNTALEAYAQLRTEGYLEPRVGSGTFVTAALPDHLLHARAVARASRTKARPARAPRLSTLARQISASPIVPEVSWRMATPFYPGIPAYELFPVDVWRRLANERWADHPGRDLLDYGDPAGLPVLREAIANYLTSSRGLSCESDQVIIVGGSQQGLYLASQLLLDPGDRAWCEDPGYRGARVAFDAAGAEIVSVPVDREGIDVAEGRRRSPGARLAYVTPSHQYPLGSVMSLARRLELLSWASSSGAWIIEDDYDSEFRYSGRPLPALQGLDEEECVVYMGTFSKILFPSLRLGYLVVPRQLIEAFLAARALVDRHRPSMDQAVLARFMADGHFERHLRRTRAAYQHRRDVLGERLQRLLSDIVEIQAASAGMHLLAWLPDGVSDNELSDELAKAGVSAPPLSYHSMQAIPRGALILGYTGFREPALKYRAKLMASIIRAALR